MLKKFYKEDQKSRLNLLDIFNGFRIFFNKTEYLTSDRTVSTLRTNQQSKRTLACINAFIIKNIFTRTNIYIFYTRHHWTCQVIKVELPKNIETHYQTVKKTILLQQGLQLLNYGNKYIFSLDIIPGYPISGRLQMKEMMQKKTANIFGMQFN